MLKKRIQASTSIVSNGRSGIIFSEWVSTHSKHKNNCRHLPSDSHIMSIASSNPLSITGKCHYCIKVRFLSVISIPKKAKLGLSYIDISPKMIEHKQYGYKKRSVKMAQWLRGCAARSEDLSSILSTHMRTAHYRLWLQLKGQHLYLFWPPWYLFLSARTNHADFFYCWCLYI